VLAATHREIRCAVTSGRGTRVWAVRIGNAGESVTAATVGTDVSVLKAKMLYASQRFDEKNIPSEGRNIVVRPAQYYLLLTDDEIKNSRYDVGGSSRNATVSRYAGWDIHKSIHLPSSNITTAGVLGQGQSPNDYAIDATNTVAALFHRTSIATVKLMDLAVESDYSVRHQGTLVVSKYAMGHGVLRPESAMEFKSA